MDDIVKVIENERRRNAKSEFFQNKSQASDLDNLIEVFHGSAWTK